MKDPVVQAYKKDIDVVDGTAAIAHGSARLTQDLDIVYQRSRANLDRLVVALADLKPYLRGVPPGLPFVCLSLSQLIHAKRAAGRPKDFEALAELEAIEEESSK